MEVRKNVERGLTNHTSVTKQTGQSYVLSIRHLTNMNCTVTKKRHKLQAQPDCIQTDDISING